MKYDPAVIKDLEETVRKSPTSKLKIAVMGNKPYSLNDLYKEVKRRTKLGTLAYQAWELLYSSRTQ